MIPIDYLLLAGSVVAGGYVIARLLVGWLRSSGAPAPVEHGDEFDAKTGAPWNSRK